MVSEFGRICGDYRIGRFKQPDGSYAYGAWIGYELIGRWKGKDGGDRAKEACAAHMQKLQMVDRDEHNRSTVPKDDVRSE